MYQHGFATIPNNAGTLTVNYPSSFAATPSVLVPVVRNTSADGSKLALTATPTAQSASGFTVKLSANTNSANYELVWVAGDEQAVLAVFSALSGRSVTSYPTTGSLRDSFLLPAVFTSPQTQLKNIGPEAFWASVMQRAASQPTTPGDQLPASSALAVFVDELNGYMYLSGTTKWLRVALDGSSNWASQPFFAPFREVEVTLSPSAGVTEYNITFPTAFSAGNNPVVDFSLRIPDGVTTPAVHHAVVKGNTALTGFTLLLNAPLTHNLIVYYTARQLP